MPDDLYDRDILTWSEQQAALLRQLAAGERLNEKVDWENVVEEIESVGRSELNRCESLLLQALIHLLKLHAWPQSLAARHWLGETLGFMLGAQDNYAPSMEQRIDMTRLFRNARKLVLLADDDSGEPRPLPQACPYTIDDLLDGDPDLAALVEKLMG